ncbi:GPI-ANCHORED ADHESIN-LIKE PROTEIN [Salix viminalis]|uniref:GPI-ANCHORED ADHESIN-LIKE PROTEIN n=2 Tax=Salix TaxID=40685 RepID=A0A9Q0SGM3_SALVM|nr:GPI-ANCHORED ADHESIN-LIKE PROTEIN [Salix viminalis]
MAATCSPTSLQLRLAMNCYNRRVSPPARTRPWMRNMEVGSGSLFLPQNERRFNGDSWIVSSSAADNFAGWSDSDHDSDQSIENQRKKWLGGTVGAGVAGVILFAGLTFAALSLSKWSTSRPKQQIEPFTTQQEVSLASDKEDDKVEESKSEASNDSDLESKTGTQTDLSSSPEPNEAPSENKLGDSTETSTADNVDYATNASGTGNNDSFQEDLQYETSFDDKSVGPEMTPSSEILPSSEIDASFPVSTFEVDNTPVKVEPSNVPDITNLNTDHKTELVVSKINENSDPSLNSYTSTVREPNEPVGVNISDSSPMNTSSEPQIVPEDDTEAVASLLTKENLNLSNATQNSADRNSSALEVNYLDESDFSGTVSEFANNEMKESKQFFELPTPEISFSSAGIPAPSAVSAALQVLPGKVLVPAVVDQLQGQTFAALQVLKVIEADDQPSDLCTRREYARWLVAASSALSRSTVSKVYPAMYIENVTELAFDDIKPDDPDFSSIQGLAEAGFISSKLSNHDLLSSSVENQSPFYFAAESPLSRQDLVSWKMVLDKRQLPEADKKMLYMLSGFRDIDKINPDAWPALVADLSAGDQGIISLAFGCTRLFQPDKPVTKAQAAVALATGEASDTVSEELARIEAESVAENAVSAHNALVAQVEQDINASFEKELSMEREKINAVETMAEEVRCELERLRAEREKDDVALMKERIAIESEMEVLSKLRREVEEQLQSLLSNKVEISYEKERISKLQKEAESEKQEISRLQYDLEVERKALSMARAWAEDEAKRAREQAKALEEARYRWEKHGIKVVVDSSLDEESSTGVTWLTAGKQIPSVEGTVSRAENLVDKLKLMADNVKGKSLNVIGKIIQKVQVLISFLREWTAKAYSRTKELQEATISKTRGSIQELQQNTTEFSFAIKEKAIGSMQELQQHTADFSLAVKESTKRVAEDCREGVEKLTQKFKS